MLIIKKQELIEYIRKALINISFNVKQHDMFLVNFSILLSSITFIMKNYDDGDKYILKNISNVFINRFFVGDHYKYSLKGRKIGRRNNLLYETHVDFTAVENVYDKDFISMRGFLNINKDNHSEKILSSYTIITLKNMLNKKVGGMEIFDYEKIKFIFEDINKVSLIDQINYFLSLKRFHRVCGIEYSKNNQIHEETIVSSLYIQHKHFVYRISDHWGEVGRSLWTITELKPLSYIGVAPLNKIYSNKNSRLDTLLGIHKLYQSSIEFVNNDIKVILRKRSIRGEPILSKIIDSLNDPIQKGQILKRLGIHNPNVIRIKKIEKSNSDVVYGVQLILRDSVIEKRYSYKNCKNKFEVFITDYIKELNK